jgi:hypothetical protein
MARTFAIILVLGVLFNPHISWSETNMSNEQSVADWVKRRLLTKEQGAALKSSPFLSAKCTSSRPSSCRPIIDFGADCSVSISTNEFNVKDVQAGKKRSGLIEDLRALEIRIAQYPTALKAFGKWNKDEERRLAELKQTYDAAVVIANKKNSPVERLREAKPVLEKAEKISEDMAHAAGFVYEPGCGAPGEDSKMVDFRFSEKPKSAVYILQMNFDWCRRNKPDPYNVQDCEAWQEMKEKNNALSGNYRYRVIWADGTRKEEPLPILSRGRTTIEINK